MSKSTYVLHMTSKGTFTMPAKIRKELGLKGKGDKLIVDFSSVSKELTIKKPADLRKIQLENSNLIKSNLPPFNLDEIRAKKHAEYSKTYIN